MLIVTVEKINAVDGAKWTLHRLTITNDATGNHEVGNYDVALYDNRHVVAMCRVEGYVRGHGALRLAELALGALGAKVE